MSRRQIEHHRRLAPVADLVVRRLNASAVSYHCPKCNGLVYNRRHKLCGFCGAELPAEILFTQPELDAMAKMEAEAEQRRQLEKTQEEAQEKERREKLRRSSAAAGAASAFFS